MTTDQHKRQAHSSVSDKDSARASSLIIQLPTTSAIPSPNGDTQSDQNNNLCQQQQQQASTRDSLLSSNQIAAPNGQLNQHQSQILGRYQRHRRHQHQNHHHNNNQQQQQQQLPPAPQQHHHHHRINHHRYQQTITHSSIDHHLLQTSHLPALSHSSSSSSSSVINNRPHRTGLASTTTDDTSDESSGTPPPNYHEIPGIVPSYHGRTSGPPPPYDDVVNPNAPPPSYQSLFGQVREARKTSNGLVDLLRQLFLVLIGTLGCTMIIGFLLLIPITMIFTGIFYINECRAENIPFFLVIGGLVWIMKNILNCYNQFKKDSTTINRPPPPPRRATLASTTARPTTPANLEAAAAAPPTVAPTPSGATQISVQSTQSTPSASANASLTSAPGQPASTVAQSSATTTTPTASSASTAQVSSTTTMRPQTAGADSTSGHNQRHIRHPPMIGITSYKCESILNYFLIVWFLAGCIVIYRIYEPDYDNPLSASYCNRTVYLYAFWLMTSAFIIMAIILSCLCCLMASSLMSCSHGR